jgi:hypothetical protein
MLMMETVVNCKQAQVLSISYITGDLDPASARYRRLETHLASCRSCAREYEACEQTIRFLGAHRAELIQAFAILEKETLGSRAADLRTREQDLIPAARGTWPHGLHWKAAAIAACLVLGMLVWLICGMHGLRGVDRQMTDLQPGNTHRANRPLAGAGQTPLRIALCRQGRRMPVAVGELITTRADLKELLINDMHRLVLNQHTSISIETLRADSRIGCLIRLGEGELFAEVRHDGHPFVVEMPHGKATITGTAFDIKATPSESVLVVVEGTVRFESAAGSVQVPAGRRSTIIAAGNVLAGQAGTRPSTPASCDAAVLTTWAACGRGETRMIRGFDASLDDLPMPSLWPQIQTDPGQIECESWLEQKRPWFQQQFPWIFELEDVLAKRGIETGYTQLLMQSGDVWQFRYPERPGERMAACRMQSISRLAQATGCDPQWLREHLPRTGPAGPSPGTGEAFTPWIERLNKAPRILDSETLLTSLDACVYLIHTRTLSLLMIRERSGQLPDGEEFVALLTAQLEGLGECVRLIQELSASPAGCRSSDGRDRLSDLVETIKGLRDLEIRVKACAEDLYQ